VYLIVLYCFQHLSGSNIDAVTGEIFHWVWLTLYILKDVRSSIDSVTGEIIPLSQIQRVHVYGSNIDW